MPIKSLLSKINFLTKVEVYSSKKYLWFAADIYCSLHQTKTITIFSINHTTSRILFIFPVLGKLTHICFFCMYGYPHKPFTLHAFFQFVICRYKYAHKLKCICAYKKNPHCHHLVSIIAGASRFSCRLLEVRPSQFGLKSVPGVSAVTSCSSLIHSFPCLSSAYKLFLIFNDVSWLMQPFIQCLDTKTLHLPLRLPHESLPSP